MSTKAHTQYTVKVDGEAILTRSAKPAAIKQAEELHAKGESRNEVEVVTGAGTVVFALTALVAAPKRAKPNTRTEVPNFEVPEIDGYVVAYTRNRIQTAVLRGAEDLLVVDTRTDDRYHVANTTEARQVTNTLQAERKAAVTKARAEAKAAKQAERDAKVAAELVAA
ncbi:MAG TPA: hypothetical protein VGP24_12930 [Glaciihabitans sp.]|jgi:hypothetical protein|nr:hypothetical protein [Glaciihabitans sp.]